MTDTVSQSYSFPTAPQPQLPMVHVFPDPNEVGRVFRPELGIPASPLAVLRALLKRGRPAGAEIILVVSSGPAEVTVPGVLGVPLSVARERIELLGLEVGQVRNRTTPGRPDGLVLEQRPSAGSRVSRGTAVDLTVTKGN